MKTSNFVMTGIATMAIVASVGIYTSNAVAGGDQNQYQTQTQTNNTYSKNFRGSNGQQQYGAFSVDTSQDVFVNAQRFRQITGGMNFVDENGDGICDIAQNTSLFQSLGIGNFVDANEDGICDLFQTHEAYKNLGMNNFVDVDGDGICDNYELIPR